MMQFLALKIIEKRYETAEISFCPVGHTKNSCDAKFGNFKTDWNRSEANCLKDVCEIAARRKNTVVVLVANESGETYIQHYDWSSFLASIRGTKKIRGIRKMHHFRATHEAPRMIIHKETLITSDSYVIEVLPNNLVVGQPAPIQPIGLNDQRRKYLFSKIRPFVSRKCQDTLCPKPV